MADDRTHFIFNLPPLELSEASDDKRKSRTVSGVAYSGGVLNHGFWGDVIFDLSTTTAAQKTPLLLNHDPDKRAGFTKSVDISDSIVIDGILLSNDFGGQIATESDAGFPWQMSVHIQPNSIVELNRKESMMVNGAEVTGPLSVFKDNKIREMSFTPTGVDDHTSAAVMSHQQSGGNPMPNEQTIKIDQLRDEVAALELSLTDIKMRATAAETRADTAEATLLAEQISVRTSAIADVEAKTKRTLGEAEKTLLMRLDKEAFDFMIQSLLMAVPVDPPVPAEPPKLPDSFFSAGDIPASGLPAVNPLIESAKVRAGGH